MNKKGEGDMTRGIESIKVRKNRGKRKRVCMCVHMCLKEQRMCFTIPP